MPKQKNNSLCYSERLGCKQINKLKIINVDKNKNKKVTIEKYEDKSGIKRTNNNSSTKNGNMEKIFFPETVNDREGCQTERKMINNRYSQVEE